MGLSDNELVESVRGGDRSLFSQLVDRYKDRAMTLAVRVLRNHEDAEEAVQDAFVRAYRGLANFQGSARFGTWLYRIVYNVCLTRIGKRRGAPENVDTESSEVQEIRDVEGPTPHDVLEGKEKTEILKSTIESLPVHYRTVVTLFYLQEMSYEEISRITELPLGTVKAHLFRARGLLLKRLSGRIPEYW